MTEKEKLAKENEEFSSAILYVATAIYIAVCAMVMGGLAVKQPTYGDAFLLFFKDYGAIIAGVPVLIAVLVAKQQLDANRRQHVATVKRSFKSEIDTLDAIEDFTAQVIGYQNSWFYKTSADSDHPLFPAPKFDNSVLENWPDTLPPALRFDVELLKEMCDNVFRNRPHRDDFPNAVSAPVRLAVTLKNSADEQRGRLSQYWS